MKSPLQITWRDLDASDSLAERIRREVAELERAYERITACRVVIERPHHRHHRHGGHYRVNIELSVPGRVLSVTCDPERHRNAEDAFAAVNEAFWAMRRQLEDYVRVKRGSVKQHEGDPEGTIVKLLPADGCGFIAADDGVEVYFHQHSVLDGAWPRVAVGDRVRFHAEQGDRGPQASSVHLLRR